MRPLHLLLSFALLLAGCASHAPAPVATQSGFVKVDGTRFTLDGKPYRFAGANFWYGAYLGAADGIGDRARLRDELASRRAGQEAKGWKPEQSRPRKVSTALKAYALLATSADKGAVRDKALLDSI